MGYARDFDGKTVFGGPFGFLPVPGLEIGVTLASGKATVTSIELAHGDVEEPDEHDEEEPDEHDETESEDETELALDLSDEAARDYDVFGFDFVWSLNSFALRGEYVKTKVGAADMGVTASPGATWESWYTQASYVFPQTKWEAALRYTDFDSPHASQDQKQWALGINYLFTGSFIGKATYEFNDGLDGSQADTNRWMFQLAYGF